MLIDLDAHLAAGRGGRRLSRFWAPRTSTLAQMHDALANDLVLLRGPAGVGKSALLQQFAIELGEDPAVGVQLIDATTTTAEKLARVVEGFHGGPDQHVLIVDSHRDEGPGITSDDILRLLREDPALRVVAATRHVTGLESPLIALEFDSHLVPAASLLMNRDELVSVLVRNGVDHTDEAVDVLHAKTHGWPALIQLAGAHLRLDGLSLRTRDEAEAIHEYASSAFTADMERRLEHWSVDDIKPLAIPPYVTAALAEAIGIDAGSGTMPELMEQLREAGFVWPSASRLVLAEPIRDRWLRDIVAQQPEVVERARRALRAYLVSAGEPVLAARLAADAKSWAALSSILRSAGSQIWLRDRTAFDELVAELRREGGSDPLTVEMLITLDPESADSPETPVLAVAALSKLPDAKTAASTDLAALVSRIHLLRAAGRFALASEAATLLVDHLRRRTDIDPELLTEAWYQVAMTHLAMGKLRDAAVALGLSQRASEPPQRIRARGTAAVLALLEGDVVGAAETVAALEGEQWYASPWGEPARLAAAWLLLERGDPRGCLHALGELSAAFTARELWAFAASIHSTALLESGGTSDALGTLRWWMRRTRSTPPSHFHSTQVLLARAKVMIALRQARKAAALFEGPFGLSAVTAPAIALSLLYAGRAHDAYVMSIKWGLHGDATPRAALECLIVSIIADLRLNGPGPHRPSTRRAEALSVRHGLWDPWGVVGPDERDAVFGMLPESTRRELQRRASVFEASVSVPHLTRREQVVLNHLSPSSTIADIARALVVSPNTVKTQLQSLYRKLEVADRASAIRAAHAWGLIDSERDL